MKFATLVLGVSTLAFAANEPVYNPATAVDVIAVISGIREVPAGQPMEGVHLTVKNKANTFDVYLGPTAFLKMLKTSFPVGDEIDIMGSRVKFQNADVILAREVTDPVESLVLRDLYRTPVWNNWGVE